MPAFPADQSDASDTPRPSLLHTLWNLFSPPVCAACRQPGALLCAACRSELAWIEVASCGWCAAPLATAQERFCPACAQVERPLWEVRAPLWHGGPVARLIHRLKYEQQHGLAALLAGLIGEQWRAWGFSADCLIPVPLHPSRERERGYNQSHLLARALADKTAVPLVSGILFRTRHTRPQVGLAAHDRKRNVAGAFSADPRLAAGRHIVLVDDVFTTGSTLLAAALALRNAGAVTVDACCVARAQSAENAPPRPEPPRPV